MEGLDGITLSKPQFSKKRKGKTVDPYPLGSRGKSKTSQTKKNKGRPKKPKGEKMEEPLGFNAPSGLRRYVGVGLSKKEFRQVVSADGGNAFSSNWVKKRISISGNQSDMELANANPGKIIRYNPESYRSGKEGFIEILDPDDYSWKEIRGFKIFSRDPVDPKVRKRELRGQRKAKRALSRNMAPRVLKSKEYKAALIKNLERTKKELRTEYRKRYGSAPKLSKKEFAEQLSVIAYSGVGPKESGGRSYLGFTVPARGAEKYDPLPLSPGVSPVRAASEKEALELHAKALNIQRYKIRDGYLYYTADNKRMRLQVRGASNQYAKVGTPTLPTGHFLLTESEIGKLQELRTKRAKGGGDYTKVSTPTLPTGHFLLTDREVRELTSRSKRRRKRLEVRPAKKSPKVKIKVSGERRVRKGATRRYTWKVYVGRKLVEEGTRSTREEARGAAEKAAKTRKSD